MMRRMWAPKGWERAAWFHVGADERDPMVAAPVLVTDATDMPEFSPGDRVRMDGCEEGEVVGYPIKMDASYWRVPVKIPTEGGWRFALWCDFSLTLIPPETSRLIRVTGAPEEVARWEADNGVGARGYRVRVEVVEDER